MRQEEQPTTEDQDHGAALEWYRIDMGPGPQHSDPFPEKEER